MTRIFYSQEQKFIGRFRFFQTQFVLRNPSKNYRIVLFRALIFSTETGSTHHHKPFAGAVAPLRLAPQKRKEMALGRRAGGSRVASNFSEEERRRLLEQRESSPRSYAAFDTKTNDDSGVRRRVVLAAFLLGTVAVAAVTGAAVSSGAPLASSRGKGAAAAEEAAVLDKSAVQVMSASSSSFEASSKTTSFTAANRAHRSARRGGRRLPVDGRRSRGAHGANDLRGGLRRQRQQQQQRPNSRVRVSSLSTWRVVSVSSSAPRCASSTCRRRPSGASCTPCRRGGVPRRAPLATSGTGSDAEEDVGKVYVRYVRRRFATVVIYIWRFITGFVHGSSFMMVRPFPHHHHHHHHHHLILISCMPIYASIYL